MQVVTTIEVPAQRIADLMITAIEGGIGYWASAVKLVSAGGAEVKEKPWYADPTLYEDPDMSLVVVEDEASTAGASPRHVIGRKELLNGLAIMQAKYPAAFADFMTENEDAETADMWLQCAALGDVVYG